MKKNVTRLAAALLAVCVFFTAGMEVRADQLDLQKTAAVETDRGMENEALDNADSEEVRDPLTGILGGEVKDLENLEEGTEDAPADSTERMEDPAGDTTEDTEEQMKDTSEGTEDVTAGSTEEMKDEDTELPGEASEQTEAAEPETESKHPKEAAEDKAGVKKASGNMALPSGEFKLSGSESMKIYAINLGDNPGDSVLIESDGEYLLMDLGESKSGRATGAYAYVKKLLTDLNVKKLSLYYSHFHGDHTGGVGNDGALDWLTSEFEVTTIYAPAKSIFNGKLNYDDTYEKIERVSSKNNENTQIRYLEVGDIFGFGSVSVEIIGPVGVAGFTDPGTASGSGGVDEDGVYDDFVNNCSLVARVTCGNTVYLTAGDAKTESEEALIRAYGVSGKLDADIYKLSHHGIAPANSKELLSYVTPICSFGMNGGYTGNEEYGTNGKRRRITYSSKANAGAYGLSYMVADEQDTFLVDVTKNTVKMYRYSAKQQQLKGIVRTYGSYGVSYDNNNNNPFDFYDYYYLDADSRPITGIQSVEINSEGKQEKHFFESGGRLYTGTWGYNSDNQFVYKPWLKTDEGWQYYDQKTAVMMTGWKTIDGEKYYFDPQNGCRYSGICTVDGKRYYFKDGGGLYLNRWININGKKRYVDKNGIILTGFQKIEGTLYYLDPKNDGIALTGGSDYPIKKIGSQYYAVKDSGRIFTDGWKKYSEGKSDRYRFFDSNGVMKTGWFTEKGNTYYLTKSGSDIGFRKTGVQTVDKAVYYFGSNGIMRKSQWYNDSDSGKNSKHWMYFEKDGKRASGWKTIDGDKYYFSKDSGYRKTGVKKIKSDYYYFSSGGKMQKNKWYNDSDSGKNKKNWMYFGKDGKRAGGLLTIKGETYYFSGDHNYRAVGLKKIKSKYYYFDNAGKMQKNKTVTVDGYKCKLDKKGVWKNLPSPAKVQISKTSPSKKKVKISWKKKSVSGYEVYMSTSKKGTYEKAGTVKKGKTTSYTKSGLKSKKTYYFKVRSYVTVGGYKFYSKYSSVKSGKAK